MEESGRSRVVLRHQSAEGDVEEVSKKKREMNWEWKGVVDSLKFCVCVKVKFSLC
jgi:hypothetical protein